MVITLRNFSATNPLNAFTRAPKAVPSDVQVYALRSLPPVMADEIPGRFSSSSLPPSFASGRFAGFSSSLLRRPHGATGCLG